MPSAAIVGMTMLGEDEQPTTAIYTNPESPGIHAAQYREAKGFSDDDEGLTMDLAGVVDLLRRASQRENVKLRLIAQRIIERRSPTAAQPEGGAS